MTDRTDEKKVDHVRNSKLRRLPPNVIEVPKEFITRVKLSLQGRTLNQIVGLILGWSVFVMFLTIMQGFHFQGFDLPVELLRWLGATVFAAVATAFAIAIKLVFTDETNHSKHPDDGEAENHEENEY